MIANTADMPRVGAPGFGRADPHIDDDSTGPQQRMAASGERVRILDRRHHPRDPRRHDGVGAGRRPAMVGAWLQRRVKRRPPRRCAGTAQGFSLRMGTPARLRPAAADNDRLAVTVHHHGAHGRVRPGIAEPTPAQREGERHEALVEKSVVTSHYSRRSFSGGSMMFLNARISASKPLARVAAASIVRETSWTRKLS